MAGTPEGGRKAHQKLCDEATALGLTVAEYRARRRASKAASVPRTEPEPVAAGTSPPSPSSPQDAPARPVAEPVSRPAAPEHPTVLWQLIPEPEQPIACAVRPASGSWYYSDGAWRPTKLGTGVLEDEQMVIGRHDVQVAVRPLDMGWLGQGWLDGAGRIYSAVAPADRGKVEPARCTCRRHPVTGFQGGHPCASRV